MDAPRTKKWPLVVGIVAGVLVIAVVIASYVLDSVLTNKAHEQAAQYSQQLDGPITIGSVSTRILTGLGATVKDVSIGPAAGEGLPLAEVKSADVRVGLLRAIFSAGKDVVVRSAEVDGLNVNVIRFDDGTTNLERLQNKLAQTTPKKEEKAPAEQKQSDLSNLRVDHAALRDARIALVDKTGRGFDRLVYVWGADHHGDVKRVLGAAQVLGIDPSRVQIVLYQLVSLYRGGEPVRMSKRTGEMISLDELLDEVGTDAARYTLLTRSPDTPLIIEHLDSEPDFTAAAEYIRTVAIDKGVAA